MSATDMDAGFGGTAPDAAIGAAAGAAADPMMQLLDQLTAADPRLRLIVEMMRARSAAADAAPPAPDPVLRTRYARLCDAYSVLRGQYERLASALGACPRCWGEDVSCRRCGGDGASGAFASDPELYEQYVRPAVRRHRALAAPTDGMAGAARSHHTAVQREE